MEQLQAKHIGQVLKDRRNQLGYTQEFAAEKAGISYSYYTKIERGEQLPSLEVCLQLAQVFHLSLDRWLLDTSKTSCRKYLFTSNNTPARRHDPALFSLLPAALQRIYCNYNLHFR